MIFRKYRGLGKNPFENRVQLHVWYDMLNGTGLEHGTLYTGYTGSDQLVTDLYSKVTQLGLRLRTSNPNFQCVGLWAFEKGMMHEPLHSTALPIIYDL